MSIDTALQVFQYCFYTFLFCVAFSVAFTVFMIVRGETRHRRHQQAREDQRMMQELTRTRKEEEAWDNMLSNGTFHYKLSDLYKQYEAQVRQQQTYIKSPEDTIDDIF